MHEQGRKLVSQKSVIIPWSHHHSLLVIWSFHAISMSVLGGWKEKKRGGVCWKAVRAGLGFPAQLPQRLHDTALLSAVRPKCMLNEVNAWGLHLCSNNWLVALTFGSKSCCSLCCWHQQVKVWSESKKRHLNVISPQDSVSGLNLNMKSFKKKDQEVFLFVRTWKRPSTQFASWRSVMRC